MKPRSCPYLGIDGDPTTALDFPSQGNCCYHSKPLSAIKPEHQAAFCLSGTYNACPIFQAKKPVPLPAHIRVPSNHRPAVVKILALLAAAFVVILAAGLYTWLDQSGVLTRLIQNGGRNTGITTEYQIPASGLFGERPRLTSTPYQPLATVTQSRSMPLIANCQVPQGWLPYTIQPTDSLFRLSVLYGVSLQVLHNANCLTNSTVLQPGDIIYVPEPAIFTATASPGSTENPGFQPPPSLDVINPPAQATLPPAPPTPTAALVVPIAPRPTNTPIPTLTFLPTSTQAAAPTLAPTLTVTVAVPTLAPTPTTMAPTQQPTSTQLPTQAVPPTTAPTSTPTLPTPVPPTPIPPTPVPPTPIPPTPVPPTPIPPTTAPTIEIPPTEIPPTDIPPTDVTAR